MRPRSVFQARPVKDANLPGELETFSRKLSNPEKSMVRLLRLVVDHGPEKVANAVRKAEKTASIQLMWFSSMSTKVQQ